MKVCNEFPDAKIEAALREKNSENARAWLNGLMNGMLDAAAPLSNDLRRQQAHELVQQLPRIAKASTYAFEAGLRNIALVPDD